MNDSWKSIPGDLFDFASFYDEMAERMPDGCRIAEVGNADGKSAIYLAEKLHSLGKDFRLKMIDNLDYGKLYQLNVLYSNVYKSGLHEKIEIIPVDSLNASLKYPDQYYDLIFVDTNHTFELTKAEIRLWWRKVKEGGILAGHDTHITDVTYAVREVTNGNYKDIPTEKGWGVWVIEKTPELIIQ